MVSINYSSREVCCKIVYYGPGLSGKTTNLLYVHEKVPSDTRGKMISLATEADRTLYFDFLPINIGSINGFAAKFQLYTVPGQVYYNATRKLVLRGVDGVVFVADSQPDKMDENIESLLNLEENLKEYGYDLNELPMVLQYNKCDLPGVMSPEEMNARLNVRNLPWFQASATVGNGVFDTLKKIIKMVLEKAKNNAAGSSTSAPVSTPEPQAVGVGAPMSQPMAQPTQPAYAAPSAAAYSAPAQPSYSEPMIPEPTVQPEEAQQPDNGADFRPYPGSEQMAQQARSAANSTNSMESPVEVSQPVSDNNEQPSSEVNNSSPTMAPSLKKRKEKKRGFFKRLFGKK